MNRILTLLLTITCSFFTVPCFAQPQGQAAIDSLLKELPHQKEDTNKVHLLHLLSWCYSTVNPDEGIKYGQQGLDLANKLEWLKGAADMNNSLGLSYSNKSEYTKAMECYDKAIKLHESLGNDNGVATVTTNIGSIFNDRGDYSNALACYNKALKLFEGTGNKINVAKANIGIGTVYRTKGDFAKALEYLFKARKLHIELDDKTSIAQTEGNIAIVYAAQGNYSKALEYNFNAMKLFEENGEKSSLAVVMHNISGILTDQSDYPGALQYIFRALKLFEELGNKRAVAFVYEGAGVLYSNGMSNYTKALEYYSKALKLDEEIGEKSHKANVLGNIGAVYCDGLADYPKALEYFFKSLMLAEEIGNKQTMATSTCNIGNVYKLQKNYTQAMTYYEAALTLNMELGAKVDVAANLYLIGGMYLDIIDDTALNINNESRRTDKLSQSNDFQTNKYKPGTILPRGRSALLAGALDHLQRSLVISKDLQNLRAMQNCYERLVRAYELNGQYKKALEASDNYHAIKDSVFSQENKEEVLKIGMKNDYDRQRLTDSLKVAEKQKIASINLQKQKSYTYMGVAGILLLAGFSFFIVKERGKSEKSRKQSDELLLNILPEEVAAELKNTGTTTARHFDNVTVLFTDFVNFTQASENMGAQNLIDELHTCFKKFDEITEKFNIEKIKTIGDAYLAVAGLPSPDPKHAENIVKAAQEITAFMEDRLGKMGVERTFQVRVGIHSGSVVAGIVGVKKFAYDIWGDTVNTAARMEQNSEAGKINISQTTYELVKDKFTCEDRGEVEAKGKGVMKMYYLSTEVNA